MKLRLLSLVTVIAAIIALVPGKVIAQAGTDDTHSDLAGHSRFWTYYTPTPSNYIGSAEWWHGDSFSGDWWGMRNMLDDSGVEIIANYTTNLAGNVTGGKTRGFTYTDNIYFGMELNFEKLFGWQGGSFTVSGLDRNGTSLSQRNIGNQFTVQQIYGGETVMFYALVLEQKLFDDKVDIKIGRFATGDDFASSPIYWLYMNNGIDGNPQALPVNTAFSAYPWAVWAARLKVEPTKEIVGQVGIYQASNRIFDRAYHGVDWSMRPQDGVLLISQLGWRPEFFKRPLPSSSADPKDVKKMVKEPTLEGYPGHYWMGFYFTPWSQSTFVSTATPAYNAYGFYWHADQMIYRPVRGKDMGLTIWSAFVVSPQQNLAKLPMQINGGVVYKGLVPTREQDQTIFGVVFGRFGTDYAQTVSPSGAGYPTYELDFEWAYRINFSKFFYVQPDVQYIINPGGTGNIPNALVLGSQIGLTF